MRKDSGRTELYGQIENCYSCKDTPDEINYCSKADPISISGSNVNVLEPTTTTTTRKTTTTTTSSTTKQSLTTTQPTASTVAASECRLGSLSVSEGTLTPAFSPDVIAYMVNVPFECASIRISATPYDSTVKSIEGHGAKDLEVGSNTFNVTATAQNGTQKAYIILVTRAQEVNSASVPISPASSSDVVEIITTSETTTTTEFAFTTAPSETQSTDPADIVIPDSVSEDNGIVKIFGIILGLTALFAFGFLSGYFIDKSMKKKELASLKLNDLMIGAGAYPQPQPPRQPIQPQPPAEYVTYPTQYETTYTAAPYTAATYESSYGDSSDDDDYYESYEGYSSEPLVSNQYDGFGGLSGLTNAAYSEDDQSADYYNQ